MSIKKKLGLGMASATLGLTMVAGGTYAYFNDTETIANTFAAGKLDLSVVNLSQDSTKLIELSKLKPGDTIDREFKLQNSGNLAIMDVLMNFDYGTLTQDANTNASNANTIDSDDNVGTNSDALAYLDQFVVNIFTTGTEGTEFDIIDLTKSEVTLADIYKATNNSYIGVDKAAAIAAVKASMETAGKHWVGTDSEGRINIASNNGTPWAEYDGLPASPPDFDNVHFQIEFKDSEDDTQNVYQGNGIDLSIDLEARQWNGINSLTNDHTGTENQKAHPQDEASE
jgi:spore coat-associated protein N